MADPLIDPDLPPPPADEEPLFARGVDGRLIVARTPTVKDLDKVVKVRVDGSAQFVVPKAVPATDAQGNIRYKADGSPEVRATTIYDATRSAPALMVGLAPPQGCPVRIPVLCHRDHLSPVAVCRVCAVQIVKPDPRDPTKVRVERKLLPACQHPVEDGMEVHTIWSPDAEPPDPKRPDAPPKFYRTTVRAAVQGLYELLAADHVHPERDAAHNHRERRYLNELADPSAGATADLRAVLAANWAAFPDDVKTKADAAARDRLLGAKSRFAPKPAVAPVDGWAPDAPPELAPPFVVDHNNCILCDRCVRACGEVKPFRVISRGGKGPATRITFDLTNLPMADSSCRQCGECMTACPTGAITFQHPVLALAPDRLQSLLTCNGRLPPAEVMEADEMLGMQLFARLPKAFLEWNRGAVRRRTMRPGDVLAEEGEFGTTAFLLLGRGGSGGRVAVCVRGAKRAAKLAPDDPIASTVARIPSRYGLAVRILDTDMGEDADDGEGPDEGELFGEMSLMTNSRRGATLVAVAAGEVLEIDRNVLHVLLRDRFIRAVLDARYAQRAVKEFLPTMVSKSRLFSAVTADSDDPQWVSRFSRYLWRATSRSQLDSDSVSEMFLAVGGPSVAGRMTMSDLSVYGNMPSVTGNLIATAVPPPPDSQVQLVRLTPGQVVCRAGDPADNFYLIRSGFIGVEAATPGGPRAVRPLTVGDCFGEVALLMGGRRTATCTALDHAELVLIPNRVFDGFMDRPENARVRTAMRARAAAMARGNA